MMKTLGQNERRREILFSHGTNHSWGVAFIFILKGIIFEICDKWNNNDGRFKIPNVLSYEICMLLWKTKKEHQNNFVELI